LEGIARKLGKHWERGAGVPGQWPILSQPNTHCISIKNGIPNGHGGSAGGFHCYHSVFNLGYVAGNHCRAVIKVNTLPHILTAEEFTTIERKGHIGFNLDPDIWGDSYFAIKQGKVLINNQFTYQINISGKNVATVVQVPDNL